MAFLGREILAQGARRLCGIEEAKDLSIWPKYRLQREEEFEKLRKKKCPEMKRTKRVCLYKNLA